MARLTVDDLTQPVTRQQVQSSIYAVLAQLGVNTTSWKPGSVVRTIIVSVSVVFSSFSDLMAAIARSGFLELAADEWLTLVAWYVYGVDRLPGTFASGEVLVSNASDSLYVFDPGDLIIRNAISGLTYRNAVAFSIAPDTDNVVQSFVASEIGAASSAAPHEISQVVTTLPGLTCDNVNQLVGTDEETDTALRQRCTEQLGALSPMGPWDAYSSALRNATRGTDGPNLGITRVSLVPDGYGRIDLYAATASGTVPGDVDTEGTDLWYAQQAVQRYAEPQAVTAVVHSATTVNVSISYTAWVYNTSGQTDAQIKQIILDALRAFFPRQPVGGNIIPPDTTGKIYLSAIVSVIQNAMPEIFRVVITLPIPDIALTPQQIAVLVPSAVAGTIVPVPPPEAYHP